MMSDLMPGNVLILYDLLTRFRIIYNLLINRKINDVRKLLSILLDSGILKKEKYDSFVFMLIEIVRLKGVNYKNKATEFERKVLNCIMNDSSKFSLVFKTYHLLIKLRNKNLISEEEYEECLVKLIKLSQPDGSASQEIMAVYQKLREKMNNKQRAS